VEAVVFPVVAADFRAEVFPAAAEVIVVTGAIGVVEAASIQRRCSAAWIKTATA
jgi:hypothetical protein